MYDLFLLECYARIACLSLNRQVCTLVLQSTFAEQHPKIYMADGKFFQGFTGYSCYWTYYTEVLEWARINNDKDAVKCAKLCMNHERCTGFEMSYSEHDPYCAFWYGGACGHEEMRPFAPFYFGAQVPTVSTYVLMDGKARFYESKCDYKALNMSTGTVSYVPHASESTCTKLCDEQKNCTVSVAPINKKKEKSYSRCDLLSDPSCKRPTRNAKNEITTIKYDLTADPFTDAYGLCNPFSEVLRGYSSCTEYAAAFPCDCEEKLGEICTDSNGTADMGAERYVWTQHKRSACQGESLGTFSRPESNCKSVCEERENCGCFKITSSGCKLYDSTDVADEKNGKHFDTVFSLKRVKYDPQATLADICPTDCDKTSRRENCHIYPGTEWYHPTIVFLMILTPSMFVLVLTMAIWTYLRRRCFSEAPAQVPAMRKKDIKAMGTEKFTSESELKYGEIECSICIAPFEVGDVMRVMKCGHRFHKDCVDEWLSRYKAVCPLCKVDMRGDVGDKEKGEAGAQPQVATAGDIEMGDVQVNESSAAEMPSDAHAAEPGHDDEPQDVQQQQQRRVSIEESETQQLSEPLLEKEDEEANFLDNDSLATADDAQ